MQNNRGILCLDIATTTGWSFIEAPDKEMIFGSFTLNTKYFHNAQVSLRFQLILHKLMAEIGKPEIVGIEAPVIMRSNDVKAPRRLLGLINAAECICWQNGVREWEDVNVKTNKKHFTGNGSASKQEMIDRAMMLGYEVKDDNEADAVALGHYVVSKRWKEELWIKKL
jgi:crossover junction endodeoxyribonuclease RuvC